LQYCDIAKTNWFLRDVYYLIRGATRHFVGAERQAAQPQEALQYGLLRVLLARDALAAPAGPPAPRHMPRARVKVEDPPPASAAPPPPLQRRQSQSAVAATKEVKLESDAVAS
jgi:hypothetical protein